MSRGMYYLRPALYGATVAGGSVVRVRTRGGAYWADVALSITIEVPGARLTPDGLTRVRMRRVTAEDDALARRDQAPKPPATAPKADRPEPKPAQSILPTPADSPGLARRGRSALSGKPYVGAPATEPTKDRRERKAFMRSVLTAAERRPRRAKGRV